MRVKNKRKLIAGAARAVRARGLEVRAARGRAVAGVDGRVGVAGRAVGAEVEDAVARPRAAEGAGAAPVAELAVDVWAPDLPSTTLCSRPKCKSLENRRGHRTLTITKS